jgi:RHS repeat-associated protein
MESYSINAVVQAEYQYNALGQQAIRTLTQSGDVIHSVFDLDGNRIAEYYYDAGTGSSTLIRGQVFFVRTDHIGRPVFATNDLGVKVWETSYLPFGGVHSSTGGIDLRFPGQWFQSESGLHQNWMRDYDPTTGRYIQADPLGLVDGASVYGYALQNPGRFIDFWGSKLRGEMRRINFGIVAEVIGKKLAIHSLTEWVAIFEAYTAA